VPAEEPPAAQPSPLSSRVPPPLPPAIRELAGEARALREAGRQVIDLAAGEPGFDSPPPVVEACIAALREGFTRATPPGGTLELVTAIRDRLEADRNLGYTPGEVLASCGSRHSLFNAFLAILDPGGEVLIPSPAWNSYGEMVRLAGGVPVFVPAGEEEGFLVSPEHLEPHLTTRTRALVLNSPANPTGAALDPDQLAVLGEFALRHRLWIISDEVYHRLVYHGFSQASIASLSPRLKAATIVVDGLSMSLAMTGWRLGWAAGPRPVIDAMRAIQSHSVSHPASFAQRGGAAALRLPPEWVASVVARCEAGGDCLVDGMARIPGLTLRRPRGGFFLFPGVSRFYGRYRGGVVIDGSVAMARFLLERAEVATVPGILFGEDGHLRLSFTAPVEDLALAADRIGRALADLTPEDAR
jgi:aspartate aminotransferase